MDRRKRNGFDLGEVKLAGGMVDVEADDVAVSVEVRHHYGCSRRPPVQQLERETMNIVEAMKAEKH